MKYLNSNINICTGSNLHSHLISHPVTFESSQYVNKWILVNTSSFDLLLDLDRSLYIRALWLCSGFRPWSWRTKNLPKLKF